MRKINLLVLICALLVIKPAFSYEVITDFEKKDLPVLNQNWDEFNKRVADIEGGIDIGIGTTGILSLERGGTGEDLSGLSQGDIIYYDGSNLVPLPIGSLDQVLYSDGSNPVYGTVTSKLSLVSNTPVSTVNSGDIGISPNKLYKVFVTAVNGGTGATLLSLRFNSLSTGVYNWYSQHTTYATPTVSDSGAAGDGEINFTGDVSFPSGIGYSLEFTIDTFKKNSISAFLHGEGYIDGSAVDFNGILNSDVTISDFEIFTGVGDTFIGNVLLYEYEQ